MVNLKYVVPKVASNYTFCFSVSPPVSGGVIRRGSAGKEGTFRYPAKK